MESLVNYLTVNFKSKFKIFKVGRACYDIWIRMCKERKIHSVELQGSGWGWGSELPVTCNKACLLDPVGFLGRVE